MVLPKSVVFAEKWGGQDCVIWDVRCLPAAGEIPVQEGGDVLIAGTGVQEDELAVPYPHWLLVRRVLGED